MVGIQVKNKCIMCFFAQLWSPLEEYPGKEMFKCCKVVTLFAVVPIFSKMIVSRKQLLVVLFSHYILDKVEICNRISVLFYVDLCCFHLILSLRQRIQSIFSYQVNYCFYEMCVGGNLAFSLCIKSAGKSPHV